MTSTFAGPASGCGDRRDGIPDAASVASRPDASGHATDFVKCDGNHTMLSRPGVTYSPKSGWTDQYKALQEQSDTRRAPQKLLARAIDGHVENVVSAQALATLRFSLDALSSGVPLGVDLNAIPAPGIEVSSEYPRWWEVVVGCREQANVTRLCIRVCRRRRRVGWRGPGRSALVR